MGKYKKLGMNIVLLGIGQFSSKILVFLLVPLYTSVLTTEEYGTYDLLMTMVSLLTPFFTLLISEAVMRFCLDENANDKELLTIGLLTVGIGSLAMSGIIPVFTKVHALAPYKWWLIILFVSGGIYSVLTQFLKGTEQIKLYSICGVLSTIILIILNILFLLVFRYQLKGYLIAHATTQIILSVYICLKINIYKELVNPLKISKSIYREVFKYTLPMIPNSISWWIVNSSDKYMLLGFINASAVGIYSISYKIPSMLTNLVSIFTSAWQISAVEKFGSEESKAFYSNIYKFMLFISVFFCSLLILIAEALAQVLYQKEFFVAWKVSTILLIAFVFSSLATLLGSIYTSAKQTKMLFVSTLLGGVINIILNMLLIPLFESYGAAVATLVSYTLTLTIRLKDTKKIIKFDTSNGSVVVLGIALIVESAVLISAISAARIIALCIFCFITIACIYETNQTGLFNKLKGKWKK